MGYFLLTEPNGVTSVSDENRMEFWERHNAKQKKALNGSTTYKIHSKIYEDYEEAETACNEMNASKGKVKAVPASEKKTSKKKEA
jgi:hypothetical protein